MDIINKVKEVLTQSDKPIMIELGGCDGYHSNMFVTYLSNIRTDFTYIILEPVKRLAKQIQDILSWCPNVKVIQKAVASTNGVVSFYESDDKYYGSSSIRKPTTKNFEFWSDMKFSESTCETITLDTLIDNCGLQNQIIDFIWSDIQGAEGDLIEGGKKTLNNTKFFYTEFLEHEIYEGQLHNYKEICSLLPNFEVLHKFDSDILFRNKNLPYQVVNPIVVGNMQPKPPISGYDGGIYRPSWR